MIVADLEKAEQGDLVDQYMLGIKNLFGHDVTIDYCKVIKWFFIGQAALDKLKNEKEDIWL